MKCRQIHESDGQRTLAVILELGDEIAASLTEVARDRQINAAQLSASEPSAMRWSPISTGKPRNTKKFQ